MILSIPTSIIDSTPFNLNVGVGDAVPDSTVTFSVDSEDLLEADVSLSGILRTSVPIPELDSGTYTLVVTDGTSSDSADFTVTEGGLDWSTLENPDADEDTPAFATDTRRWRLLDPLGELDDYTFERNPASWTSPHYPVYLTFESTTGPRGQILSYQASGRTFDMEFSGLITSGPEHAALVDWSKIRRRFWLIDHRWRAWFLTFVEFDARARRPALVLEPGAAVDQPKQWMFDYTMKCMVFRRDDAAEVEAGEYDL